ncbi:MAG: CHASE2 domain-containing sensor protein/tRNA A-37 threonylcarbamoyl transferase component Bud32 [Candidatus Azotimanducaceae bacterium]|jgi:CHASE2 domain-containing sensor protein/tRNA A-37 threonylcarbamoyl transferase component Bud32
MRNPLKRWDVFLTLLIFFITIPAEKYEVFSLVEDQTISFRHILRSNLGPSEFTTLREEIMIVALDEALYEEYGSFPFRRTDLGRIASLLSQFGAKVVALDFLMDFSSSYGEDEPTAQMFSEADNVLLVSFANFNGERFEGLSYPNETLKAVTKSGYSNLQPTSAVVDNLARLRIYDEVTNNKDGWPFAIQAISMFLDVEPRLEDNELILGDLVVPLDQFGDVYIDFPRLDSGTQFLSEGQAGFSALEILDIVDMSEDEIEEYRYIFGGKIVFIGDTWEVTHDKFNTPMGPVYGVEIIANTVNTLLNGAPLRPASLAIESLATFVFFLALIGTSITKSLSLRLFGVSLVYVGYIVSLTALYVYFGMVITMTYALLGGLASVLFSSMRLYVLSEQGQIASAADSAESNRMLGLAYQGQGQLDAAFEKFRSCPKEKETFELLYNLGLDYERKRQFNKAQAAYEFIAETQNRFRDISKRIKRCESMEDAVLMGGAGQGLFAGAMINDDGSIEKPMLGRYQVEKELGQGAMGIVYLGLDPKINRQVAIKTMALGNEFESEELTDVKERFFKEAESAGRLNHAGIVAIYDAGDENDLAYIAMELLKGSDLDAHIKKEDLLPIETVLSIVIDCAEALDYAHTQNVVHRDIKPSNIMYDPESGAVKIADFGIARLLDSSKTRTGTVLGTPNYMSPEQCMGKGVDGRADLFSLGVVLYQLCSGDLPFKAESMATLMYSIVNDPPIDIKKANPDIPPTLRKVIHNAIGKKPEKRYQTGKKFAQHLRVCLERMQPAAAKENSNEP